MHRVLEGIIKNKRIAAAYLFFGPPNSAKEDDAHEFAKQLGCGKFDLVEIGPDGATVKIEQVRELQRRVRSGPAASEYLVVIVGKADTLTADAAAAFLKTLEEPPPKVVFILAVERADRLPETIMSRCQRVVFGERYLPWQAAPENSEFYAELTKIKGKNPVELFKFSALLEKEKERLEELLYDLAYFAREKMIDLKLTRILLEAVKNLKKKAGLKITLDVACLKMGET